MTDYLKKSTDLVKLLPAQHQDKTLNTALSSVFNKHLLKTESSLIFGNIGSGVSGVVDESTLERQINQLSPVLYNKHGTQEFSYTWNDIIQKMVLLGVDVKNIDKWLNTESFNFVPPIDLDKFCNFNEYYWIGKCIQANASIDTTSLGILTYQPSLMFGHVEDPFLNTNFEPDYFVIEKGRLNGSLVPPGPQAGMLTWSAWSFSNLWVHKEDLLEFAKGKETIFNINLAIQATRPILEYSNKIKINEFISEDGAPTDNGIPLSYKKHSINQPPQFDIYNSHGEHVGATSSIFFYKESQESPTDSVLGRRIVKDENTDFVFSHSLVNENGELYCYKEWNETGKYDLSSIWKGGDKKSVDYVKFDNSGTIINKDKLVNFGNYYWIGISDSVNELPSYNLAGDPVYTVVESGGTSDWSKYNYWVHANKLQKDKLKFYTKATEPILEFNLLLDSEIINTKTSVEDQPFFRKYKFDSNINDYVRNDAEQTLLDFYTEAYIHGSLIVNTKYVKNLDRLLETNQHLQLLTFSVAGHTFLQSFDTGYYLTNKNGIDYNFKSILPNYIGVGSGSISTILADKNNQQPDTVTIVATSPTTFEVSTWLDGIIGTATVNTTYNDSRLKFTITNGDIPFVVGDSFVFDINTSLFEKINLFVKLNGVYKTFDNSSSILSEIPSSNIVKADVLLQNGEWAIPDQIQANLLNETRTDINQGDLFAHFVSIIKEQDLLSGKEYGVNNYRNITKNFSKGGLIKQFNGDTSLMLSLLLQDNITPLSILEFAKERYAEFSNNIIQFIENEISDLVTERNVDVNDINSLLELFYDYNKNLSIVTSTNDTQIDDFLHSVFSDTTSSIKNCVATLPYLGLVDKVLPEISKDLELNIDMITHHDGHKSILYQSNVNILKNIVTKTYKRSNGQITQGIITAGVIPSRPYKNQFWFNTITNELFTYDVISDNGELPLIATHADRSYDRSTNKIYEFINNEWIDQGSTFTETSVPWTKIDISDLVNKLTLQSEIVLFENCPEKNLVLNAFDYEFNPLYNQKLKEYFESFGRINGLTDLYSLDYNPADPFTWNYSYADIPVEAVTRATWQSMYQLYYGTARPDLEPWKITQESKQDFLDSLTLESFEVSDWSLATVQTKVKNALIAQGKLPLTSVNFTNGQLLPPFGNNVENLITIIPQNANKNLNFDDKGPLELVWRKSNNFLYDKFKVYFKLNPLEFISKSWGYKQTYIGNYTIDEKNQQKNNPKLIKLHGEKLVNPEINAKVEIISVNLPEFNHVYKFTCVDDVSNILKLTLNDSFVSFLFINDVFIDDILQVRISNKLKSLNINDVIIISIDDLGNSSVSYEISDTLLINGLNQLYVQYNRYFGNDLILSNNTSVLRSLELKLGYRLASLINNESLIVKNGSTIVDRKDYNVLLKENKFINGSWLDSLRIQLVQKGSCEIVNGIEVPRSSIGKNPGDDWVFRVDNFNTKRAKLNWYVYDLESNNTFLAMGGERTLHSWKRFNKPVQVASKNAPFLITGIQNVANFLFGYSDYLADQGWVFNDPENPSLDPNTKRVNGWQLTIEEFINQQFGGASAGTSFLFNLGKNKIWYKTPRGFLADVNKKYTLDIESTQTILDKFGKTITDVRVFRDDEITQISSSTDMYTLHLLTSEYEHILLLNNYTSSNKIVYDAFLGIRIKNLHIDSERQLNFNGRLSFGGQYLLGDQFKNNIENSVESISKYYDIDLMKDNSISTDHARALLGFQKKSYFINRELPDRSEFKFWQGLIKHKGSNLAVNAFLNSAKYRTASMDEYWAYRVASYGDARSTILPELKIDLNDVSTDKTRFLFIEGDEFNSNRNQSTVFDLPLSKYPVYTNLLGDQYENFVSTGSNIVLKTDDTRWYSYDDLNTFSYFEAKHAGSKIIQVSEINEIVVIKDDNGNDIRGDIFELHEIGNSDGSDLYDVPTYDNYSLESTPHGIYYEGGEYILNSVPPKFTKPQFERINHNCIKITGNLIIGRPMLLKWYTPNIERYSPSKVINYKDEVLLSDDVIMWDPARSSNHPIAIKNVDISSKKDPARYNVSTFTFNNDNYQTLKVWGEKEVGKVWWNTKNLNWKPYSDTKINPDFNDRLSQWGSVADYSDIEIYEWIKTTTKPQNYLEVVNSNASNDKLINNEKLSGEPANLNLLKRIRTWYQKPIVWAYSKNPQIADHDVIKTDHTLYLESGLIGDTKLVSDTRMALAGITGINSIAMVNYPGGQNKLSSLLFNPLATTRILSDKEKFIVGTDANMFSGAYFVTNSSITNIKFEVDDYQFGNNDDTSIGQFVFKYEQDVSEIVYLSLTCLINNKSEKIIVDDTSSILGSNVSYQFQSFGITMSFKILFNHSMIATSLARKIAIASNLSNVSNKIYIRSYLDVQNEFNFQNTVVEEHDFITLDKISGFTQDGWVGFNKPATSIIKSDFLYPFNKWSPIIGQEILVGDDLVSLSTDIKNKQFSYQMADGTILDRFTFYWKPWMKIEDKFLFTRFIGSSSFSNLAFGEDKLVVNDEDIWDGKNTVQVYINETTLNPIHWDLLAKDNLVGYDLHPYDLSGYETGPGFTKKHFVRIHDDIVINEADSVVVKIKKIIPTPAVLEFNPSKNEQPTILYQYLYDYEYVEEIKYNEYGNKELTSYYYWVKNKVTSVSNKKLSVKQISTLLEYHDGVFATHQNVKYFNQLDNRPNRYSTLIVDKLSSLVGVSDTVKFRICDVPSLRNDDYDMKLKNIHEEWILLRENQNQKIPFVLWETMINSLCNETVLRNVIPESNRSVYDKKHKSNSSYGLKNGQIFIDGAVSKDTVKYIIENTKVNKYDNNTINANKVTDFINFDGFDINQLSTYLATPESTRKLMMDIWLKANIKQINEIFFALLEDALSKNYKLDGIFKTSYVSLFDVRIPKTEI